MSKIAIIGATGRAGSQLLEEALDGHQRSTAAPAISGWRRAEVVGIVWCSIMGNSTSCLVLG